MLGLIVLAVLLVSASIIDHREHRVPNVLTGAGLIVGFVLLPFGLLPSSGWIDSSLGLIAGFIGFIGLYVFKKMGAGDVKLMAVVGFYLGLNGAVWAVVLSFLVGGGLAVLWIVVQLGPQKLFNSLLGSWAYITTGDASSMVTNQNSVLKRKMPYAAAIALGTTLTVFLRS